MQCSCKMWSPSSRLLQVLLSPAPSGVKDGEALAERKGRMVMAEARKMSKSVARIEYLECYSKEYKRVRSETH